MAENAPQSFASHRRFVPPYHFVLFGILLVLLGWAIYGLIRTPSAGAAMNLLLIVALLLMTYYLRTFPLTAQDRIIRLEERLRLERLLPDDLKPRIGELGPGQLIGLRFAGDEELPELARAALEEKLGREAIKKRVRSWRADHFRM